MSFPVLERLACLMSVKKVALLFATCLACSGNLDNFNFGPDMGGGSSSDMGQGPNPVLDAGPDMGTIQAVETPTDILFVVDNSGSMADEQQNLADSFARFIDQTAGAASYRIAVVSTDMDNATQRSGQAQFTYSMSHPYELVDFDLTTGCFDTQIPRGCFNGPIIDTDTMDRITQIQTFRNNVNVGTCGSGNETGLEAMISALEQAQPGGCNEGFLRPDANLLIVFVSDENDAGNGQIEQHVLDLGQLKPYGQVRVATIVGAVNGDPSDCSINEGALCGSICMDTLPPGSQMSCNPNGNTCPQTEYCDRGANQCRNSALQNWTQCNSCSFYNSPDCCAAVAGSRYIEFARAVEVRVNEARPEFPIYNCKSQGLRMACLADTICQTTFNDTLSRIAREIVLKP